MESNDAMLACFSAYLHLEKNASPHTILNYQADVRHFLEFIQAQAVGEEVLFHRADILTARLYLAHLSECNYAQSTVSRKIACLRSFFKFLCSKAYVEENPFLRISLPKAKLTATQILHKGEIEALLEIPSSNETLALRDRAILEVLYGSGLRSGELVRLCIADVDFEKGIFLIYGNGLKARITSFDGNTRKALLEYLDNARPQLLKTGASEALFLNKAGNALAERSVRRILDKYASLLQELENINPQLIRRSFAARLLQKGFSEAVVRKVLGKIDLARIERSRTDQYIVRNEYMRTHPRA